MLVIIEIIKLHQNIFFLVKSFYVDYVIRDSWDNFEWNTIKGKMAYKELLMTI